MQSVIITGIIHHSFSCQKNRLNSLIVLVYNSILFLNISLFYSFRHMENSRQKTISLYVLKRIILIVFGITTILLVLELYFVFFNPQKTLSRMQAFSFKCFEEGKLRWIKLTANKTCILSSFRSPNFKSTVKTNSLGLRNREIDKKDKDAKRILFIGDSFTMGWAVEENQTFVRVAEKLLNQDLKNMRFETINAGFSAAGPSGYYIYLKKYAFDLDPDIIVVDFYLGNDITSRNDVQWVKTDENNLPEIIRSKTMYVDYEGQLRFKNWPIKYHIPFFRESHLFVFLMDKFFPSSPVIQYQDNTIITPLVCLFKQFCRDMDKQKQEVKNLFLGMQKIALEKQKKLIVVLIPAEFQVYMNRGQKYAIEIPLRPIEKELPNKEFTDFFAENKIDHLDLLPFFQKEASKSQTYLEFDDHWNQKGHQVSAEAIAQKILQATIDTKTD